MHTRRIQSLFWGLALFISTAAAAKADRDPQPGSPIDIPDLIRFATIGDPGTIGWNDKPAEDPAVWAPNGSHFAVVVRGGNPEQETNDATLLVYAAKDLRRDAAPRVVARFSSATNSQPLALVRWLADSRTLVFAGTSGSQPTQIFSVNIASTELKRLTNESRQLVWFDISAAGEQLVTLSEAPVSQQSRCRELGCTIDAATLEGAVDGAGATVLVVHDLRKGTQRVVSESHAVEAQLRRDRERWIQTKGPRTTSAARVVLEQSPNRPPTLVSYDARDGARKVLLDPNPWLQERLLTEVRIMEWEAAGQRWRGAFHYPQGFVPNQRYPLVIQAGFSPDRFSMNGNSRAFAARALAALGIAVLELDTDGAVPEWAAITSGYRAVIDQLSGLGLIDPTRVGIHGSGPMRWQVEYVLSQSSHDIAVGALTGGFSGSWLSYLAGGTPTALESLYGAAPFGEGRNAWRQYSPSFSLDRVSTPMMLWQAGHPMGQWEWYAALRRHRVPVEYWIAPGAVDNVFQVRQRMRLNSLIADWFKFWLIDAPGSVSKNDSYERWQQSHRHQCSLDASRFNCGEADYRTAE